VVSTFLTVETIDHSIETDQRFERGSKMTNENTALSSAKVAIVTGGSRGLGRNTVINLAKRGVNSIFTYNPNRAEADNVVAAVTEAGARVAALQLDAGNVSSFDAFVHSVRSTLDG
jgi:NAD(P)-dependent dehydrogenase (short-subunit alcohol dehydrogenase family)